jgi:AraC family ethanolamine operon transcriptional activator
MTSEAHDAELDGFSHVWDLLQAVRVQGVRKQLGRPGGPTAVSVAAASWGFWHMGKFAAEYRSFFGELASETLTRRFGRPSSG